MTPVATMAERLVAIVLILMSVLALVACRDAEPKELDIPAGFATATLKEFARQADVEIIFDSRSVYGVKTHAVSGNLNPQSALRIMLKNTPLVVDYDEETGAYAIVRVELSMYENGLKNRLLTHLV